MTRLTSEEVMSERIAEAIAAIEAVLEGGHPLQCSSSFGKDSAVCVSLAMVAARNLAARGLDVPEIHVVSVDTLVEQPEVVHLRAIGMAQVREYAARHGLPVHTAIVEPRLAEQWWPRIIGGRKLPSYIGSNGDCSVSMKAMPLTRYVRALDRRLAAAGGPPPVTIMGTRFGESAIRGSRMRERGESALVPAEVTGKSGSRLVLSPIAHWETEQVFCYLQNVGSGRRYDSFAPDFQETLRVYSDSAGAGCMIDTVATARGAACGARHGCYTCCRSGDTDRSMQSLLLLPEYSYLRGVSRLRDYLVRSRWDFSKRNWISRSIDEATGDVQVFPNNFSAAECERLLRMVLTVDERERRRAAAARRALEAGRVPDTAWNRRMSEVQFQNLNAQQVAAIDYYWSCACLFPPFHAWRVLKDVLAGNEMDVPEIEAAPRPAEMPPRRTIKGDLSLFHRQSGVRDPAWKLSGADSCGDEVVADDCFEVDEEAAYLFMSLEMDDMLRQHEEMGVYESQKAASYYVNLGMVAYPASQTRFVDMAFRQGQYLRDMGLLGITSPDQVADRLAPVETTSASQLTLFDLAA